MSERRVPVTLVIVDSGPLISLAACDCLDLLDQFSRRVRVTDVVKSDGASEVYMLSTRMFLKVLENFEIIGSASDVVTKIADAGRALARYAADRPGKIAPGVKSQWTDPLKSK